ncbi:MAG: translation elongation factor Ts [Acidimicrobiales bacterium]
MPDFTAKDVQALRQSSGAGMLDAKRALEANEGDMEAAGKWLREKGLASAAKRQDRQNSQGAVAVANEGGASAVVELKCETDFVAKAPDFVTLVEELAQLAAKSGAEAVAERQGDVDKLGITLKENIALGRVARFEGGPAAVIDSYLHIQNGRGVNAVIVELSGGDKDLAHDIAVHVAFTKPPYLSRQDVPADQVEAERATLEQISRNENKPEAAMAKIVEGRLTGWFKERCLLEQDYVKDEKRSIKDLLGSVQIVRFEQVVVGS